jgi:hypothetical protein
LELTAKQRASREAVYWDQVLLNSGVRAALEALPPRVRGKISV